MSVKATYDERYDGIPFEAVHKKGDQCYAYLVEDFLELNIIFLFVISFLQRRMKILQLYRIQDLPVRTRLSMI